MRATSPSSIYRRIERLWAERTKVPGRIRGQIAAATERTLLFVFGNENSLIPVPIIAVADRRRFDPSRSHD
jgi:hypothetical protein